LILDIKRKKGMCIQCIQPVAGTAGIPALYSLAENRGTLGPEAQICNNQSNLRNNRGPSPWDTFGPVGPPEKAHKKGKKR
jgi:hypothetical protein